MSIIDIFELENMQQNRSLLQGVKLLIVIQGSQKDFRKLGVFKRKVKFKLMNDKQGSKVF